MNKELLIQRLIKAGVVSSPQDDRLCKRQFDTDEWLAMPDLLKQYFYLTAPKQADEVMAEIAAEKKNEQDQRTKWKQERARELLTGSAPTEFELDASDEAVAKFIAHFPQYIRTPRNMNALFQELHRTGTSITSYEAIVEAFEACCARGELLINLKAIGLGDRVIDGIELERHPKLDRIMMPVKLPGRLDHLSSQAYLEYNNKIDRENGIVPQRTPRAEAEAERLFTSWFDANPGFGVFQNQDRAAVRQLIFQHLDDEGIAWSQSAVADAAEYLYRRGVIHRDSDATTGETGEFTYGGTRLVVHKVNTPKLPATPQQIELVERVKKITVQDLRKMSAQQYAEALKNPALAAQIEELLKS